MQYDSCMIPAGARRGYKHQAPSTNLRLREQLCANDFSILSDSICTQHLPFVLESLFGARLSLYSIAVIIMMLFDTETELKCSAKKRVKNLVFSCSGMWSCKLSCVG